MDFDDLCDANEDFDTLRRLKDRDAGFKVTLFAIPTRCSDELFARYDKERDWIQLGMHGWRHARHECLGWTSEETEDKLKLARAIYPNFAPVFKAPNWEMCDEVYAGCLKSDVGVADHIRNMLILPEGVMHYIYNVRLRNDHLTRMHGHIQPFANTGLAEAYDTWSSPPVGSEYRFVSQCMRADKEVGG
jgi:hypothetical protein